MRRLWRNACLRWTRLLILLGVLTGSTTIACGCALHLHAQRAPLYQVTDPKTIEKPATRGAGEVTIIEMPDKIGQDFGR